MKAQAAVNRYPLRPATTSPERIRRSVAPVVESPRPVYLAGVGLGIGCGAMALALLLGVLSLLELREWWRVSDRVRRRNRDQSRASRDHRGQ